MTTCGPFRPDSDALADGPRGNCQVSDEQGHADTGHKRWTAAALAVVLLAVEAVIVAESWPGLTGFANLIGITGPAAWGVPITLDGVSLVAALVALRAELAGLVACRARWQHLAPGSTRCGASPAGGTGPGPHRPAVGQRHGERQLPRGAGHRRVREEALRVRATGGPVSGARAIQHEMRVTQRTAARL